VALIRNNKKQIVPTLFVDLNFFNVTVRQRIGYVGNPLQDENSINQPDPRWLKSNYFLARKYMTVAIN